MNVSPLLASFLAGDPIPRFLPYFTSLASPSWSICFDLPASALPLYRAPRLLLAMNPSRDLSRYDADALGPVVLQEKWLLCNSITLLVVVPGVDNRRTSS